MIIPKQEINELLDGLEKKLLPAFETTIKKVKIRGHVLIKGGDVNYKSRGGILLPVKPDHSYLWDKEVNILINHRKRMKNIIEEARTEEEMHTNLAAYYAKYGNPIFLNKQNKN